MSNSEFKTFGCRLNIFETDRMKKLAAQAGLDDVVIFNSCGVTNEAVRQTRQSIRKAHKKAPGKQIIVTGCAAQIHPEMFANMPEVSHVIGNRDKLTLATFEALAHKNAPRVHVRDIMGASPPAPYVSTGTEGKTRAFLEIQNGCDHRCTFCIIPFGRGPSRSVPSTEIIENIRRILQEGIHEVVLTGVDITDYKDPLITSNIKHGNPISTLGGLVQKILRDIPDLPRLRLSSIDAVEIDPALEEALEGEERLMPHLHLSLQAGDDMILKRMKRRHLRQDAIELCQKLRAKRKGITFGADIIAGFPTETEEMFANSLRLVDECHLTFLHVFPFSAREGTPAARMPQLDKNTIKARAKRLRIKGTACLERHLQESKGKICNVLMETDIQGRTPWFSEIILSHPAPAGSLQKVKITGHHEQKLTGVSYIHG